MEPPIHEDIVSNDTTLPSFFSLKRTKTYDSLLQLEINDEKRDTKHERENNASNMIQINTLIIKIQTILRNAFDAFRKFTNKSQKHKKQDERDECAFREK